ncbi:hypothetical protein GF402_02655 [Candidatus Fermentibacteria bacterium]|nr:hypothetical protein [Candidatus Fermentibacteria bacterium]
MTRRAIAFLAVVPFLLLSCGRPSEEEETVVPPITIDTLVVRDSIGVLVGDSCYMLGRITKACPLPGGGVAVLDGSTGKVSVFDSDCEFVRSFGGLGEAPGTFQMPYEMTVLGDGRYAVFDWMGTNVSFFDQRGEYLGSRRNPGLEMPMGMTSISDSCFVLYSCPTYQTEDGYKMGYEVNVYRGMDEESYSTPFRHSFTFGQEDYDFKPGYLAVASGPSGNLYISRMCSPDYRIEVYNLEGEPVDTIESERVHLPWEDLKRPLYIPIARFMVTDGDGNSEQKMGDTPEMCPQVERLGVDSLGNVWAQMGPSESYRWDLFSPDGERIGEAYTEAFPDTVYTRIYVTEHGVVAWEPNPDDYARVYLLK